MGWKRTLRNVAYAAIGVGALGASVAYFKVDSLKEDPNYQRKNQVELEIKNVDQQLSTPITLDQSLDPQATSIKAGTLRLRKRELQSEYDNLFYATKDINKDLSKYNEIGITAVGLFVLGSLLLAYGPTPRSRPRNSSCAEGLERATQA